MLSIKGSVVGGIINEIIKINIRPCTATLFAFLKFPSPKSLEIITLAAPPIPSPNLFAV